MRFPRLLAAAGYLLAAMLVLLPFLDLLSALLPLRPGSVTWRFASAGLFSRALTTPLLGLLLASALAHVSAHGRVLRAAAVCSAVLAVLVGFAGLRFLLDAGTMWSQSPDEARSMLALGSATVLLKLVLALAVTLLLMLGAWSAGGAVARVGDGSGERGEGRKKSDPASGRDSASALATGAGRS